MRTQKNATNRAGKKWGRYPEKLAIFVFWVLIWEVLSVLINNPIAIASPLEVLSAFRKLVVESSFYTTIFISLSHIYIGFFAALLLGIFLAIISSASNIFKTLVSPLIQGAKTIPVAGAIIIVLLFISANRLSIFISFVTVLPMVFTGVLSAIENISPEKKDLIRVYRMPLLRRIRFVYMPPICKTLITVIGTSIGFAFKSGVAAELIGVSAGSIGERLYAAKLYLDAPDVYAWTATIIIISILSERIIKGAVYLIYELLSGKHFHKMDYELAKHSPGKASNSEPLAPTGHTNSSHSAPPVRAGSNTQGSNAPHSSAPAGSELPVRTTNTTTTGELPAHNNSEPPAPAASNAQGSNTQGSNALKVQNLSISYGSKKIIGDFTYSFTPPKVYALFGKSGSGKTSIIRAILGLIPYSGEVLCENGAKSRETVRKGGKVIHGDAEKMPSLPNASVVFQDDVLEYDLTVWLNLKMVFPKEYKFAALGSEVFSKRLTKGIEVFGLENLVNEKVSALSGGQRRRVAILRAFCTDARYIFMDEPFKGLDVDTKEKVMEFVKQELKCGQLLIFATHDTSEADYFDAEEIYIDYN